MFALVFQLAPALALSSDGGGGARAAMALTPLQQLASASTYLAPPPVFTPAERLTRREEVLRWLPADRAGPILERDELASAIEQLELLEYRPETAAFHQLGVTGVWTLRTLSEPEHANEEEAVRMRETELALLNVEQRIEFDGAAVMAVDFELRSDGDDDAIRGRLEVDCTLALTPMADSLDLRTAARRLRLPRLPSSMGIEDLMRALHSRLSPEFRAEEGVRIGLQTTYMDEDLRITRCTTGKLRGECMVHRRRAIAS